MSDLPITSDKGATPVVINDPTIVGNVANVKAASTASVIGDNSLVVALSPNSPVPTGTNKIGVTGVSQSSTTSGQNGDLTQGAVSTIAPTYITGQTDPLSLTTTGDLRTVAKIQDSSGNSLTSTVDGSQRGLDSNIINIQDNMGTGTITALNQSISAFTNGSSVVNFQVTGTWVSTLTIQGTIDGTTWNTIVGDVDITDTIESTITTNTFVTILCGGFQQIRLIATSFTSGTINIAWEASVGSGLSEVYNTNVASLMATVNIRDGSSNVLTSTSVSTKQGLDVNLIASPTQSAAAAGQLYVISYEFNLPSTATESPAVYIKNPNVSGKILILRYVSAVCAAATNGTAEIKIYGNPTTSANGTSEPISSTSIGGGAGGSAMTVFSGPTVSATGTRLFSISSPSGNVSGSTSMPINFDGAIRVSANNTLLITGQPSTNNMNYTFSIIWQEV